jgi:hypothetical protein
VLSLGIAVNTAVFSFVNAIQFKQPIKWEERIAWLPPSGGSELRQ